MSILGQSQHSVPPRNFVFTKVGHDGAAGSSFQIDQTASEAFVVAYPGATAPSASLGTASSGLKTVTLSGGETGEVTVVTRHDGKVASVKFGF